MGGAPHTGGGVKIMMIAGLEGQVSTGD